MQPDTEQKTLPIPFFPAYTISPDGRVFYKGREKTLIKKSGRSPKLRVKQNGLVQELGLAKLLADVFLPNPNSYTRVIFKDGNPHHCTTDNIAWVSNSHFVRYNQRHRLPPKEKKKTIKKKKPSRQEVSTPCTDPSALPLPGYEGFYITPCAKLYHGNSLVEPHNRKSPQSLQVRIRHEGREIYRGLAKLVATAFLPNPQGYTRIIFKDRNNKNCHLSNIAWASVAEYNAYTESFRTDRQPLIADTIEEGAVPIPGFSGYSISPGGTVYQGNRILKQMKCQGARSLRVKLMSDEGRRTHVAVPKLVALAFVPNPNSYTKIIFKDRDRNNCTPANIQWVSLSQFASFVQTDREADELLGPKKPKAVEPVWTDPERVPIEGFPDYYISPGGVVYRGHKIIRPIDKKRSTLKVRLRLKGWPRRKYMYLGLGKLLATHFIPNPKNHKHIIFKDRNNRNCVVSNIAWVDGETFAYYAGISKGAKKIVLPREEAIKKCTDPLLREYYKTLDESWLHECWKGIEERVNHPRWDVYKSECFIYFLDRAKRFSLLRDPMYLLLAYTKGVRAKMRKEISPDIPMSMLWKTDESLRNVGGSKSTPSGEMNNYY
jgi:hypothetical protein